MGALWHAHFKSAAPARDRIGVAEAPDDAACFTRVGGTDWRASAALSARVKGVEHSLSSPGGSCLKEPDAVALRPRATPAACFEPCQGTLHLSLIAQGLRLRADDGVSRAKLPRSDGEFRSGCPLSSAVAPRYL